MTTPQNGQTHTNKPLAIRPLIVWVCLTILWGLKGSRVKLFYFFWRFYSDLIRFIVLQFSDSVFQTYFLNTVQLLLHFLCFFMLVVFPLSRYILGEDVSSCGMWDRAPCEKKLTTRNRYCFHKELRSVGSRNSEFAKAHAGLEK